jgi:hypothetical protein
MPGGPQVKLAIDLHKIERYFPLEYNAEGGLDYELYFDRQRYDDLESYLREYDITGSKTIQEFCFITLWIEKYLGIFDEQDHLSGKFYQMWVELDQLKEYLLKNRITSIILKGEHGRNKPGKSFTMKEEINIDRVCDGLRTVFRDEFDNDKSARRSKGQKNWKRRKMIKVRNYLLNYLSTVPGADMLSLGDQSDIIDKLAAMAGFTD